MGWLGSFFKKLWKAIRKVLAVILVIAAIVIAVWACLITGGAALPLLFGLSTTMMYVVAGLCLVGAFIVDKKTASKTVGQVADAVHDAASSVGTIAGAAAGGIVEGLLDNPLVAIAAVGGLAYLLLSGGSKSAKVVVAAPGVSSSMAVNRREQRDTELVGDPLLDDMGMIMYA